MCQNQCGCVSIDRSTREMLAYHIIAMRCREIIVSQANPELVDQRAPHKPGDIFFGPEMCQLMMSLMNVDTVDKLVEEIWRIAREAFAELIPLGMSIEKVTEGYYPEAQIALKSKDPNFYAGD